MKQIFVVISLDWQVERMHSSRCCYCSRKISSMLHFSSDIFFIVDLVFNHLKNGVVNSLCLAPQEYKISNHGVQTQRLQ